MLRSRSRASRAPGKDVQLRSLSRPLFAAAQGRSFSGPELAPRPARLQISSPAAQDAWGKGVDQQHSPASFCLKRLSRAIEEGGPAKSSGVAQLRRAAELVAGGVRVAGGRVAADVLRAQASGLPGEGLAGGREAAPKGAGLLELDERGAAQPLEQLRIAG